MVDARTGPVVNLATNPVPATTTTTEYTAYYPGVGGAVTRTLHPDPGLGHRVNRLTWTITPTSNGGSYWNQRGLQGRLDGRLIQITQTIRSSRQVTIVPQIVCVNPPNDKATGPATSGPTVVLLPGVPTRIGLIARVHPGTDGVRLIAYVGAAAVWQAGDTLDTWHTILTVRPTLTAPLIPYADGDTPGWAWTGTPHASPSAGYPPPP